MRFTVAVVLLCFNCTFLLCESRMSGLYIDNGVDQTIVQRFMTRQEKREVEHEILNLLGLQYRPRPANSKTLGSSAPKFLLDVYKSMLDSPNSRSTRSEFNLSGRDLHAIDESDVIMTFTSNNKRVSSVRHERGKRLWFDVSDIPVGETIVDAELRLYQNSNYSADPAENFTVTVYQLLLEDGVRHERGKRLWFDVSDIPVGETIVDAELRLYQNSNYSADPAENFTVTVYQLLLEDGVRHERGKRLWFDVSDIPVGETIVDAELRLYQNSNYSADPAENFTVTVYQLLLEDGEKELEFVDAVNTTHSQEGWLIFNMSGPISSWVAFPESNKGLYMSVHPANKFVHEMRPEDVGIVSTSIEGEEEKQPFMVSFMKATSPKKARKTREIRRRKKAENSETPYSRNPFSDASSYWTTRSCQIQTLYVSFRDLGWQDWIIAPDGYGAFYCSGECNFPLNAHMNATNHAIVQTLVHLMYPYDVPKPYCAPTKLTPISVLYFLDDSNVILKKYKNMVVKSCGCH